MTTALSWTRSHSPSRTPSVKRTVRVATRQAAASDRPAGGRSGCAMLTRGSYQGCAPRGFDWRPRDRLWSVRHSPAGPLSGAGVLARVSRPALARRYPDGAQGSSGYSLTLVAAWKELDEPTERCTTSRAAARPGTARRPQTDRIAGGRAAPAPAGAPGGGRRERGCPGRRGRLAAG